MSGLLTLYAVMLDTHQSHNGFVVQSRWLAGQCESSFNIANPESALEQGIDRSPDMSLQNQPNLDWPCRGIMFPTSF